MINQEIHYLVSQINYILFCKEPNPGSQHARDFRLVCINSGFGLRLLLMLFLDCVLFLEGLRLLRGRDQTPGFSLYLRIELVIVNLLQHLLINEADSLLHPRPLL